MPGERRAGRGKARATPLTGRPAGRGKKKATETEQKVEAKKPPPTDEEKAVYRFEVEQRLAKLGWTKESMEFPAWSSVKAQWLELLEPNELRDLSDDNVWDNLRQQLDFLRDRFKTEREKQKELRFDRLSRLLSALKKEHPHLISFKVRRLGKPPCTAYPCPPIGYSDLKTVSQELAFPGIADVHKWPVVKSMLEADTTADELEETFNSRRGEIDAMISEWRDKFHAGLLSLIPKVEGEILRPTLVVGDTNPFEGLSDDMKRILRADSLFSLYDWNEDPNVMNSSRGRPHTYKDLLRKSTSGACRLSDLNRQVQLPIDRIGRYTEAQEVARELLRDIGRPDASYLELECDIEQEDPFEESGYEGEWICGRCIDIESKIWQGIVEHYVTERRAYRFSQAELVKRKITYNDVHGSTSFSNQPMIRYYSAEVARETWSYRANERDAVQCNICSRYPMQHKVRGPKKLMHKHLSEVHGIKQPKFSSHYSAPTTSFLY